MKRGLVIFGIIMNFFFFRSEAQSLEELLINVHSIDNPTMVATVPAESGIICYNTDEEAIYVWDGTAWVKINMEDDEWSLSGNLGTDDNTDFLGTRDAQDLVIKTNDVERVRVLENGQVGIGTNVPSNTMEINSGTTGESGLTFAEMDNTTSPSAGSPIGVDASGKVINNPLFRVQTKTAAYTLQLTDHNSVIEFNSAVNVNCTVPAGLPTGFQVSITQLGQGRVTFVSGGPPLRNAYNLDRTSKRYSKVGVEVSSTGEVILSGDLRK